MTLQQLQFLITIHECGLNITLAARRLNISQPGISRQLRDLEAELGFQVFARQGRSLTHVTIEGEEIIERSARVLREIKNMRRVVASVLRSFGPRKVYCRWQPLTLKRDTFCRKSSAPFARGTEASEYTCIKAPRSR
jgi:DNA-binding transcriptional LysR family regulator